MAYTISRSADPIGANTNLYWGNINNVNYLANSGTVQPFQSSFTSIFNTRRNIMGFNCGCFPAPNTHFLPTVPRLGNRTLFSITGSSFTSFTGNQIMGGNFGGCCGSGSVVNTSNIGMLLGGCGGITGITNILGGCGGILGGLPLFGSGSTATNGATSSWSYKGAATASPYGTSVVSNCPGGKSKSINLGGLGSYSSGSGGRALSILGGLYSETRSGGNTARDFSGVVSLLTGGLF